jgi:hypothetical protein
MPAASAGRRAIPTVDGRSRAAKARVLGEQFDILTGAAEQP